jgi:DNA-binding response OmpR family regulator
MRRLVVLVVEDDPDCAAVLSEALAMDGHEVMVALRADDALVQAGRRRPDVAIVDGHLGGDAGLELVRTLRRGRGDLPVLLATGMSEAEVAVDARAAGVDEILVKPIELSVLLAAVARLGGRGGTRQLA